MLQGRDRIESASARPPKLTIRTSKVIHETSDKHLVEKLTRSKAYRDYEAAFRDATGLPLAFTPVEAWGLPLHDDKNESSFCRILAQTSNSCAACLRMQESPLSSHRP